MPTLPMSLTSLNGSKIKAVFEKTQTTKALRETLSKRKRNTPFLDLKRTYMEMLRDGQAIEYTDIVAACKDLEILGAGTYIKGRGINGDIFNWKFALRHLIEIAKSGKTDHLPSLIEKHKKEVAKTSAENRKKKFSSEQKGGKVVSLRSKSRGFASKVALNDSKVIHVYLRGDFLVEMNVPKDMTSKEAKQLCLSITSSVSN